MSQRKAYLLIAFSGESEQWLVTYTRTFFMAFSSPHSIPIVIFVFALFSIIRLSHRLGLNNIHYLKIVNEIEKNTLPYEKIITISKSEPKIIYYSNRPEIHIHIKTISDLRIAFEKIKFYKDDSILAIADFSVQKRFAGYLFKIKTGQNNF